MRKKTKIIIASILIVIIVTIISYILIGKVILKNKMNEYLKSKGYSETEIAKVKVGYSFISYVLGYGAWGISVEYVDEPDILYFYKYDYKYQKIMTNGVGGSSKAEKEDLKHDDDYKSSEVLLTSIKDIYNLTDNEIKFVIENNTDTILYTHASPTLEFKSDTKWIVLETNATAGFCGNKDAVDNSREMILILSWYDNLQSGNYRINFNIYNEEEIKLYDISKEFSLK